MDIDDEDDFYAPEESTPATGDKKDEQTSEAAPQPEVKSEEAGEDLEEGEEEDEEVEEEEEDSDIDIITERKDGTKAAPPSSVIFVSVI